MALKLYSKSYDSSLLDASTSDGIFSTYHNVVTYQSRTNTIYLKSDDSTEYKDIVLSLEGKTYYLQYACTADVMYIDLIDVSGIASGTILSIDAEKVLVTSVNQVSRRLIVTRGYDGTTPQAHNSSAKAIVDTSYTKLQRQDEDGKILSEASNELKLFLDPISLIEDIDENLTEILVKDAFGLSKGDTFSDADGVETFKVTNVQKVTDQITQIAIERNNAQPHLKNDVFFLTSIRDTKYHLAYYYTSPVKGSSEGVKEDTLLNLSYVRGTEQFSDSYSLRTYIRLVTIGTIGDSITAGHAAFRAEDHKGTYCRNGVSYDNDNTSEDVTSQYQYWLSYRLGRNYNIYNYGTGEEVGYQVKNRFIKEILSLHPDYIVIQCGTNDLSLFNGASAVDGIDSSATMDEWIFAESPITLERNGSKTVYYGLVPAIKEMITLSLEAGAKPIVGNLLPRNGLTADMRGAFDAYNNWLQSYVSALDGVYMIDFFNAQDGGEYLREDPNDSTNYNMNSIYSSGVELDEDGSVKKSGDGIHLNSSGYKIMGYCMNIDILFDASVEGFNLYVKPDLSLKPIDGELDTISNIYIYKVPYKLMQIDRPKTETRYLYNKGTNSELYYIYISKQNGIDIKFIQNDEEKETLYGTLLPGEFLEIYIQVTPLSNFPIGEIRVIGRPIESI